jgi:hypothetical protein
MPPKTVLGLAHQLADAIWEYMGYGGMPREKLGIRPFFGHFFIVLILFLQLEIPRLLGFSLFKSALIAAKK